MSQNTLGFDYHSHTQRQFVGLAARIAALMLIFCIGLHIMSSLRSHVIGESGSTMAIYSLGALFILVPSIAVFHKTRVPEKHALRLAVAAVLVVSIWFAIEEKFVLRHQAHHCEATACGTLDYTRYPLVAEQVGIQYHTDGAYWRVLK